MVARQLLRLKELELIAKDIDPFDSYIYICELDKQLAVR